MAKEARPTNTFTKEGRGSAGTEGVFGIGRFGGARFGSVGVLFPKEALPANSATKEALASVIT